MKNCLMIMHAREIPRCMDALRALNISKAWFRGYTELQLEAEVPRWVDRTDYDNYIIVSDDTVPTQKALDCITEGLERHEVFTAWCNISPNNFHSTVSHRRLSIPGDHEWERVKHVMEKQQGEFTTTFACFALTGARREIWQRFPFRTYVIQKPGTLQLVSNGWGSDFTFSLRLQDASIPVYSHRDAFVYHLASRENFIVGKVEPEVIFEEAGPVV